MNKKNFLLLIIIPLSLLIIILGLIRFIFATPLAEKNILNLIFKNNEIIYLGDSVLNADHLNKKAPSSMVNIFGNKIKKNVLEISGGAYTPFIYQKYFEVIKKYSKKTNLIIIPINLRAFSSSWNKVPEYQFEQECGYLSIVVLKPNIECLKEHLKNKFLSDHLFMKKNTFLNTPIKARGFLKDTKNIFLVNFQENCKQIIIDESKSNFSCQKQEYLDQVYEYIQYGLIVNEAIQSMRYNYHYAENILSNNISLLSLRNLIEQSKNSNIKILFYITPIDLNNIMKFSGKEVINIIFKNIALLQRNINEKNIYFLNLIDLLNSNYFDLDCACEHIDAKGKEIIINKIIDFINTKIENI